MDAETYLRNLAESELRRYRDGGPESFKTLAAHVHFLNQRLSAHGLMVRAGKGHGATYSLRKAAP